ncbi:MAG: acyclic terpene utilization AtuA family protein [Myxococcota bacterium]
MPGSGDLPPEVNADRTVVLGGASGAWGDSSLAAAQLLATERCDYLLFEALAEITMAILTRARAKDPSLGYATDVIRMIGRDLATISAQGVRVVTNAGGVHPRAAAAALRSMAKEAGVAIRIASIEGDDLLDRVGELREAGITELRDGSPVVEDPLSIHAYLGARPIAAALDAGAQVVVTGRCVDSALALGPLIHEFGWGTDDLDRLSQGSLAGHLLECGPQSTGGISTDWRDVPGWDDLGYPMAECRADGSFTITKPAGSGGIVDERTVAEQLVYEIGDPGAYLLPDVTCDWREVTLEAVGQDRVEVVGARGWPPPPTYKACAQTLDGFKATCMLFIGGREARDKAERLCDAFVRRAERILRRENLPPLRRHDLEVLGAESTYGPHSRTTSSREVVAKIALHHDSRQAIAAVVREIGSFGMVVPGLSGGGTGLPKPTPVIRLHSFAVPRELFAPTVQLDAEAIPYAEPIPETGQAPVTERSEASPGCETPDPIVVPLVTIAHTRSGDKGPDSNIGVRARHRDFFPLLESQLSADVVAQWFAHRWPTDHETPIEDRVDRYRLPGIHALNFVLHDALGGGGISSLRFDPQGKAYGQQLLDLPLTIPRAWESHPAFRPADPE